MTDKNKHIPQGYKDSPLGIIPKEWEVKRLGDLCIDIYSGKNKVRVESGTYPVYGSTGIIGKTDEYKYDGDRILVARVGAHAGQVSFASGKYDVSDNTIIVENKEHYSQYFAYQQLIAANLNKLVFGSGQPLITAGMLKRMYVICPPPVEQEKINAVLKLWDTAIEKQSELIAKLKLRKHALMQQLLTGKKRLPGFNGEWKRKKLGDIAERVTRKNEEDNKNVVTISAQRGFVIQTDFFNKSVASETLDNYYLIHKDEFCYNKSYSNGYPMGAIKRLTAFDKAVVTTLYICFKLKKKASVNIDYFEQYCESGIFNKELVKVANEGGRAHGLLNVTPFDFFNMLMRIPNIDEQNAIATVLVNADKEIELAHEKLASLQSQKRGLMQQLLTGKKRIL